MRPRVKRGDKYILTHLLALFSYAFLLRRSSCASVNCQLLTVECLKFARPFISAISATVGVALYSDVDIISSLCDLMARGAIVSMFAVILFLPAMFMLFDKVICVTSIGFRNKNAQPSNTLKERTA